ncbi:MAG: FAD:protein FMN transferase [bacterium]|nr:FAD:protein FMN transferase [bacterium]
MESISAWADKLVGSAASDSDPQVDGEQPEALSGPDTLLMTISRPAMACEFEVLLNQHQYPQAADLAIAALDLIADMEALLSVYKPRSDLSTLNRFGGERPIPVAFDTLQLMLLAQAVHDWTAGAFDITAGSLSEVWGFARRKGRKPSEGEIAEALTKVGSKWVQVNAANSQIGFAKPGLHVNPGGIGKGYALDRAARRLHEAGIADFMMHGGLSSIVARGNRQHRHTDGGWQVSLKHPLRWEQTLGTIRLRDRALGTSGSGKQFFHFRGQRYSHIIDPRSGWPAQGMLSATVLYRSAAIADALATALFVMGMEAAREFCERHADVAAILVFQDERSGRQCIESLNVDPDTWQAR